MLLGLGRLNIHHMIMLRRVKFYRHLLHSGSVFYVMCFQCFLDNFNDDCVLRTLFLSKSDVIKSVWQTFENYVTM